MSNFFIEKKQNKQIFRENINKFLEESHLIQEEEQLGVDNLIDLLDCSKDVWSAKINLELLYQELKNQDNGHLLSRSTFKSIFGTKKQMKINDLFSILKKFDLTSFNFIDQTKKYLFEKGQMAINKVDEVNKKVSHHSLTDKGKELLIQSFDFNEDGKVRQDDLQELLHLLIQSNEITEDIVLKNS